MDMIGRVKRMHFRDHLSFSDIARRTGLSRNTVKKWVKAPAQVEPRYRREAAAPGKLSAFEDALVQMLRADARRAKHERRTARALHTELKALGYEGGYSRLTDFIRAWRQGEGQAAATKAFVPLAFEWGEAFQFDWSEEGPLLVSNNVPKNLSKGTSNGICSSLIFSGDWSELLIAQVGELDVIVDPTPWLRRPRYASPSINSWTLQCASRRRSPSWKTASLADAALPFDPRVFPHSGKFSLLNATHRLA